METRDEEPMYITDFETRYSAEVFTFEMIRWVRSDPRITRNPDEDHLVYTKVTREHLAEAEDALGASRVLGIMDPRLGGSLPNEPTLARIQKELQGIQRLLDATTADIFEVV